MKKIKYYETQREKMPNGKYRFVEQEGYMETFYEGETDSQVNIVFRKDDELKWKATHLESGVLIISGYESRKQCVDSILVKLNRVTKLLKDGVLSGIINELEIYRNGVLFKCD